MGTSRDERFAAVVSHVAAVLLPILGPVLVLVSFRTNKLVRLHAVVALVTSAAWVVIVVMIISLDKGRLSVDEADTSTAALGGLIAAFGVTMTLALMNIRRARTDQRPVGTRG